MKTIVMVLSVLLIFACSNKKEDNSNKIPYPESFIWLHGDFSTYDSIEHGAEMALFHWYRQNNLNSVHKIYDSIKKLGFKENRVDIGQSLCDYKYNTTIYDSDAVKEVLIVGVDCQDGVVGYFHEKNDFINSISYNLEEGCDSLSKVLFDILECSDPYDYGQRNLSDTIISVLQILGQSTDI